MGIKTQLCKIVKSLKEENEMTYDQMVEFCKQGSQVMVHKSQLVNILKHDGDNVSVELMEYIIRKFDCHLEIHLIYHF